MEGLQVLAVFGEDARQSVHSHRMISPFSAPLLQPDKTLSAISPGLSMVHQMEDVVERARQAIPLPDDDHQSRILWRSRHFQTSIAFAAAGIAAAWFSVARSSAGIQALERAEHAFANTQ
jgi:hypothetical protein